LGGIVVLLFFKLVLDSHGGEKVAVKGDALDKALSEYQRHEKKSAPISNTPAIPTKTVRRTKSTTESNHDGDSVSKSRRPFVAPPPLASEEPASEIDTKARMDEANQFYDRGDYEGAREVALELLAADSNNVRMSRIVVSSSCIMGDVDVAHEHFKELPPRDQRQMARRCKRYDIDFDEQDQ